MACIATTGKQRDKREGVIREEREGRKKRNIYIYIYIYILVKDIFILIFNGK